MALCGDNCDSCPRHIATLKADPAALEEVKALWVRLGLRSADFPAEEMACSGCNPEGRCAYRELCACVKNRAVENCGFCHDYPCGLINRAFEASDRLKARAEKVCTPEEMAALEQAFFSKKACFDGIHNCAGK